jgi:dipeptidyl-peptidase-4
MADDNVVFEHSTSLVAELQEQRIPFELMVYPGMTHRIIGQAQQTHLWDTNEAFLEEKVLQAE